MAMIMEGCQGKSNNLTIEERTCPVCGHTVELFSVDTEVQCEHCGFTVYNDKLTCVQWCQYAEKCVGKEMYERLMKVAAMQKERAAQERKEKLAKKTALSA